MFGRRNRLFESVLHFVVERVFIPDGFDAVVGDAAAVFVEIVVPDFNCRNQVVVGFNFHARHFFERVEVFYVRLMPLYCERLVGAESRAHLDGEAFVLQFFVVGKVGDDVVGRADRLDVALRHALARAEPRTENFVRPVPDFLGGVARKENVVYSEEAGKLQVAPVVHGVAEHVGHCLGEFLEFFPVGRVARAVFFLRAVAAHETPFVVVAAQPHLGDVVPVFVFGNLLGVEMAVEVDKGKPLGEFVVQFARILVLQKKIVRNKFFH